MTKTTEQFIQFIINNGVDEDGAGAVYELPCMCMVAIDEEEGTTELIACAKHDVEDIDNDGKTADEVYADFEFAAVTTDEATSVSTENEVGDIMDYADELTVEDLQTTTEKDEEIMTTITMKNTVADMKQFAADNNIDITGLKLKAAIFARITGADEVKETTEDLSTLTVAELSALAKSKGLSTSGIQRKADFIKLITDGVVEETKEEAQLTLDEMLMADDAPMVDPDLQNEAPTMTPDEEASYYESLEAPPAEEEETVVEEEAVDAVALAQELLDLIAKGTNFSTLMTKVKENATAIVNGTVAKPEPKKVKEATKKEAPKAEPKKEQPKKQQSKADGASEASAFKKFKSATIISSTETSVTFKADDVEYIFLKNESGRTLIRKVGSNSNSYMSTGYLQSLIYDINTQQSRALFRKVRAVGASKAQAQGAGAASEASAKEKNSAAKNNSAEVISVLGTEIPKAWFNKYVADAAMKEKHGKLHLHAKTIIAEYGTK